MGHQGADRTLSLIRERFFWPYMQSEIEHYVTRSCSCLKQKKPCHETRAPLINILTTQPIELVCIDFLHLNRCKGRYEYIVMTLGLVLLCPLLAVLFTLSQEVGGRSYAISDTSHLSRLGSGGYKLDLQDPLTLSPGLID